MIIRVDNIPGVHVVWDFASQKEKVSSRKSLSTFNSQPSSLISKTLTFILPTFNLDLSKLAFLKSLG